MPTCVCCVSYSVVCTHAMYTYVKCVCGYVERVRVLQCHLRTHVYLCVCVRVCILVCVCVYCSAICTLRTSGTEPKLKYYVELAGKDGPATRRCV